MKLISIKLAVLLVMVVAGITNPLSAVTAEAFFADVRDYLPEGYVTDGSVDYKEHIQRCFDENACVYFLGSNDHKNPMIYGSTTGLKTKPFSVIRFGPNAVLKRLPSFGELLILGRGSRLSGAVIDGNKYGHWPLLKDRQIKPYAFVVGHAVQLRGQNLVENCFVYNNAGIAFVGWNSDDNKLYRCRAENCGFLEAIGSKSWYGEHAAGDGFYFGDGSENNIIKDCEAYDCSRWGFVIESRSSNNTYADCRGGNINFYGLGFLDIESAGPGNSLSRCRSPNSNLTVQGYHQDVFWCTAGSIVAEHASYPRILGCTTTGGVLRACEIRDDKMITAGRQSPMLSYNRVFLAGALLNHSLSVICADGLGIVTDNMLYGFEEDEKHSTEMLLYGVAVRGGNRQVWGWWDKEIALFKKPYYLRAYVDLDFKKRWIRNLRGNDNGNKQTAGPTSSEAFVRFARCTKVDEENE